MLYVLYEQNYDEVDFIGVFEGTCGLDMEVLRGAFRSKLDGSPPLPEYKGPVWNPPPKSFDGFSGGIGMNNPRKETTNKPPKEYTEWQNKCNKVRKEWPKEQKKRYEQAKKEYPGNSFPEMFVSYLKKEFGFKEVKASFDAVW